MASLERELDVRLITTTNQGSQLTAAGEIVARYARDFAKVRQAMTVELAPYQAQGPSLRRRVLRLCATPYLSDSLLLNFLNAYQKAQRHVTIELLAMPYPEILDYISGPKAVGLMQTSEEELPPQEVAGQAAAKGLACLELTRRPLYICAHANSPWAKLDFIPRDEVERIPLILKYTAAASSWDKTHQQFVNSFEAQKRLIRMNSGVGLVTKAEFDHYYKAEDKYVLVPVGLGEIVYLCLLPDQENMPQAVRQLLEAVETVL